MESDRYGMPSKHTFLSLLDRLTLRAVIDIPAKIRLPDNPATAMGAGELIRFTGQHDRVPPRAPEKILSVLRPPSSVIARSVSFPL